MYKFIHTGFNKYFAPHLTTYHTTYNTRRSQSVANVLNVPRFQPTIYMSTKQFGFSFAFDAPLFGIHSLKTSVHHPLWPLLERSSKPISTQTTDILFSFEPFIQSWTPIILVIIIIASLFAAECFDCTEGHYCEFPGMTEPTGECSPGYECEGRANTSTPTDGVTGQICPQGLFCEQGTHHGTYISHNFKPLTWKAPPLPLW